MNGYSMFGNMDLDNTIYGKKKFKSCPLYYILLLILRTRHVLRVKIPLFTFFWFCNFNRIMEDRKGQENFQLIVITHDERFAQLIGQRQHAEKYYRITKDD